MKRDRRDIVRAVRRVQVEELVPLGEVAELLGAKVLTVRRWCVDGFRGVHLDAISRLGVWYSSHAAALRFLRAIYELDECEREAAG